LRFCEAQDVSEPVVAAKLFRGPTGSVVAALAVTAVALTFSALIVPAVFTFVGLILFAVALPFLLPIVGLVVVFSAIVSMVFRTTLGRAS